MRRCCSKKRGSSCSTGFAGALLGAEARSPIGCVRCLPTDASYSPPAGTEGRHKFLILIILDYTAAAPPVLETGYDAYLQKFGLRNGYPTYGCSARDVSVEEHDGETRLRVVVPFPEAGEGWGDPPEVRLSTPQAARYEQAIAGTSG